MKTFSLTSSLKNIETILAEISDIAESYKFKHENKTDLQIVLVELFTNVVKHGYCGAEGIVDFKFDFGKNDLVIEVKDKGKEFKPTTYYTSLDDGDCMNENGYGIPLILSILSDVKFEEFKIKIFSLENFGFN